MYSLKSKPLCFPPKCSWNISFCLNISTSVNFCITGKTHCGVWKLMKTAASKRHFCKWKQQPVKDTFAITVWPESRSVGLAHTNVANPATRTATVADLHSAARGNQRRKLHSLISFKIFLCCEENWNKRATPDLRENIISCLVGIYYSNSMSTEYILKKINPCMRQCNSKLYWETLVEQYLILAFIFFTIQTFCTKWLFYSRECLHTTGV